MGKKRKNRGPRRKRMTRATRLQSAKATRWAETYSGKNIIRGYCTWYAVDPLCAVIELRELGVTISAEQEQKIRRTQAAKSGASQKMKQQDSLTAKSDSDETFAFIAGYTPCGFPYGVTWEEYHETCQPHSGSPEGEPDDSLPF